MNFSITDEDLRDRILSLLSADVINKINSMTEESLLRIIATYDHIMIREMVRVQIQELIKKHLLTEFMDNQVQQIMKRAFRKENMEKLMEAAIHHVVSEYLTSTDDYD